MAGHRSWARVSGSSDHCTRLLSRLVPARCARSCAPGHAPAVPERNASFHAETPASALRLLRRGRRPGPLESPPRDAEALVVPGPLGQVAAEVDQADVERPELLRPLEV